MHGRPANPDQSILTALLTIFWVFLLSVLAYLAGVEIYMDTHHPTVLRGTISARQPGQPPGEHNLKGNGTTMPDEPTMTVAPQAKLALITLATAFAALFAQETTDRASIAALKGQVQAATSDFDLTADEQDQINNALHLAAASR